jgi:hypothetical protein
MIVIGQWVGKPIAQLSAVLSGYTCAVRRLPCGKCSANARVRCLEGARTRMDVMGHWRVAMYATELSVPRLGQK